MLHDIAWSRDWVGSVPGQQLTDKIYKSLWNTITWHTYLQSISSTACPSSGITPISISIVYKINSSPQRCWCRFYSIYHFLDNCHWSYSIKFVLNLVEYELWLVLINKLPSNAVIFTPSPVKTTLTVLLLFKIWSMPIPIKYTKIARQTFFFTSRERLSINVTFNKVIYK